MTVQTCPAASKPSSCTSGDSSSARTAGGTVTCETSMAKFSIPCALAWATAIALAGAVVSKPMPKNTTVLSGCSRASASASSGEYTIRTSQTAARSRHAQHVAIRGEDHVGAGGQRQRLIHQFQRRDAHRAAGAVNQLDLRRQQFVQPALENRVGLPAADLHQPPAPRDGAGDLIQQASRQRPIAVFIQVLHPPYPLMTTVGRGGSETRPPYSGSCSASSGSSPASMSISCSRRSVSCASASSIRLRANPT